MSMSSVHPCRGLFVSHSESFNMFQGCTLQFAAQSAVQTHD